MHARRWPLFACAVWAFSSVPLPPPLCREHLLSVCSLTRLVARREFTETVRARCPLFVSASPQHPADGVCLCVSLGAERRVCCPPPHVHTQVSFLSSPLPLRCAAPPCSLASVAVALLLAPSALFVRNVWSSSHRVPSCFSAFVYVAGARPPRADAARPPLHWSMCGVTASPVLPTCSQPTVVSGLF
ncbi:hypothetical protein ABB37_08884 [Leptomonas pyrrhocoris]|uniref:Uncharacterized protein n=1 Tax=Leptomonas pyrrhocoris TaxID=157538 RepID=A0A0N0VD75_LEPPY|nr:hypothetical protein ABB37_08884 [Leptomonas pyrrhocoris]KPA74878.1 hypothetical protein ABB37_08884 [Leptomonas pyrrhocoris]|eukprot:XP_015653317.1 hypothetical protein ABB37_08884 [Leptomonas pyrrhocoris]